MFGKGYLPSLFTRFVDDLASTFETIAGKKRPPLAIVQEGASYRCYRSDRNGAVLLSEGAWEDVRNGALRGNADPVELRIDAAKIVTRTLRLPVASRAYIEPIIQNQMERLSPWSADRTTFDYVIDDEATETGEILVRIIVIGTDLLEAELSRIAETGIVIGLVGVSTDPIEAASPVNLLRERSVESGRLRRRIAASLIAGAVLLALASGSSAWLLWGLTAKANDLRARIEDARGRLVALPSQEVPAGGLLARKQSIRPMVMVIEALSHAVPSDTYLTGLAIENGKMVATGYSRDAPALIEILEEVSLLDEVRFNAATTRDEASQRDQFEIEARIAPVGEVAP